MTKGDRTQWLQALASLPAKPSKMPAFFFAHGSPILAFPADSGRSEPFVEYAGPNGPCAQFLKDFGQELVKKYDPKGIVVFSAHWESKERLVTDYGDENPLLYDYYGFDPEMYKLQFHSKGSRQVAQRVVDLFHEASMPARLTTVDEPRGFDGSPFKTAGSNPLLAMRGRGTQAPGLDHGVFVPFRIMFGEDMGAWKDVPVVEVSFDDSLDPEANWQVGKAVSKLREEGYLVLSGGLTVHNLREFNSFNPRTARQIHRDFDNAIFDALAVSDPVERKKALKALTSHPGFHACHPREDHFIPIYIAAGAGEDGDVRVLSDLYGAATVAFGV